MLNLDYFQIAFVVAAFLFQLILVVHFALRKWRFDIAVSYGRIVYALSIPAAILSILLLRSGLGWSFWLAGFLYLVWALFGYTVEYLLGIEWRNSLRWPILIPYVVLYLATVMFYWWPLAFIYKPFWYVYAILFIITTYLNVTSHQKRKNTIHPIRGVKPTDP